MNRINYKHLYYFWRVATTGNLTSTAQQLHISQSALSMQIKQLEHNLGVMLFNRSNRALVLTSEGARVLQYAEEIFSLGEALEHLIATGFETGKVHINIGVLSNLSRNFVERFVDPLLAEQKVTFTLHNFSMAQILEGLSSHVLDLALTNILPPERSGRGGWNSLLVSRQQLAIIGPVAEREAPKTTSQITSDADQERHYGPFPEGFDNCRWILPKHGTEIRNIFDTLCSTYQYKPTIQAEADDMAMLRLLARDSGSLAVLPPVVVSDEIANHKLKVIQHLPHSYENFYAITLQHKRQSSIIQSLLQTYSSGV